MVDKNKGGRPLAFKTPEELEDAVNEYFKVEDKPTLAGLAYHIGISRKTLYNYDKKDKFLHIIKKAREKVESVYEGRLVWHPNQTGVIFALKNMNWRDKKELDHTSKGEAIKGFNYVTPDELPDDQANS